MSSAIDDIGAAVGRLEAEVKVNRQVLDELAALVKADPGGSIPADQVAALIARVDQVTADLAAGVAADSPPSPAGP